MSLSWSSIWKYIDALWVDLRIHGETERGDNETIKTGGMKVGVATGECCGGGR